MIRPLLLSVLGHVVHARIDLESLIQDIITEMMQGYRPYAFGKEWGPEHAQVLEALQHALDAVFHYSKWLQTPDVMSRLDDAEAALQASLAKQRQLARPYSSAHDT